jgi:2-alkyl-3-oxoalkanoate reductase
MTAAGHEVTGLTRSQAKADLLRNMGAEPVVADTRDSSGIMGAVRQAKPEIVGHELTSIKKIDLRNFDRGFAETNRLRREGTGHLLAAAHVAGARRFVAQSFAGWPYAREGGVARLRRRRMRSIQIHQRRYTARSKRSATRNRRLPRKPAWRV